MISDEGKLVVTTMVLNSRSSNFNVGQMCSFGQDIGKFHPLTATNALAHALTHESLKQVINLHSVF